MCGGVRALHQVRGKDTAKKGRTLHARNDNGAKWLLAPPRRGVPSPASCRAIRHHREDGAFQRRHPKKHKTTQAEGRLCLGET